MNDRTLELQSEMRKLHSQIADLQEQLYAARAAADKPASSSQTSLTVISTPREQPPAGETLRSKRESIVTCFMHSQYPEHSADVW